MGITKLRMFDGLRLPKWLLHLRIAYGKLYDNA